MHVLGMLKPRVLTSVAQNVFNANTWDIRRAPVIGSRRSAIFCSFSQ
jgi:hypothetical protein